MPDADRHIDDDDLERYVPDQLSEDQAAPIDEHLLACQQCQDRLAQALLSGKLRKPKRRCERQGPIKSAEDPGPAWRKRITGGTVSAQTKRDMVANSPALEA